MMSVSDKEIVTKVKKWLTKRKIITKPFEEKKFDSSQRNLFKLQRQSELNR